MSFPVGRLNFCIEFRGGVKGIRRHAPARGPRIAGEPGWRASIRRVTGELPRSVHGGIRRYRMILTERLAALQ